MNGLRTIRNNWKKSLAGAALVTFGGRWVLQKFRDADYMYAVCMEAKSYGDVSLSPSAVPRHVTVILNPTANGGKCVDQFERYCAPLLHLAGLKVAVVRTEQPGQARQLMELMDNTDAVVVAGGNGTLTEVVTGLLRRDDAQQRWRHLPLAVVPLGRTNSLAAELFGHGGDPVRQITAATIAAVRQVTRTVDVMEVTAIETDAEVPGRAIYIVSSMRWGAFRDALARVHKYWYWGGWKEHAAYFFSAFKTDINWSCNAAMEYCNHCPGCLRCHQLRAQTAAAVAAGSGSSSGRWWSRLVPRGSSNAPPSSTSPVPTTENPDCGVWHRRDVTTVDWQLHTDNSRPSGSSGLQLQIGAESVDWRQFVSDGCRRAERGSQLSDVQAVDSVKLVPALQDRSPAENNTRWFSFDGEEFEVRPLNIRLLPASLLVFASPPVTETG